MNTWQLAEDFRAAFAALPAFEEVRLATGQCAEEAEEGAEIILQIEAQPFSANGKVGRFDLSLTVRHHAGDTAASAHAALVAATLAQLHEPANKAALIEALADTARWEVVGYTAAAAPEQLDGNRFVTPLKISGTVVEL